MLLLQTGELILLLQQENRRSNSRAAAGRITSPVATRDVPNHEHTGSKFPAKNVRKGLRTEIQGSGGLDPARNFVPNPLATLPEPKNLVFDRFLTNIGSNPILSFFCSFYIPSKGVGGMGEAFYLFLSLAVQPGGGNKQMREREKLGHWTSAI